MEIIEKIKHATRREHGEIIKLLLKKGANAIKNIKNIEARDESGYTLLQESSLDGKIKIVKLLLKNGANVNTKGSNGFTALMSAALRGHTEIIKLLLKKGANVYIKNKYGETALMIAALRGHTEIVKLLKRAQVYLKKAGGRT